VTEQEQSATMATETSRRAARISVNKLGEYMTATPLRRRRIIQDQKRPKAFILPRYTEAQDAITKYLVGGKKDQHLLTSEIERLSTAPSATEWEEQRKRLCVEALERFEDLSGAVDLAGLEVAAGDPNPPRLELGGLEVSVRPEVVLCGKDRLGRPTAGAIKLYFSKTIPLAAESGAYVATLVQHFVDAHASQHEANPRDCRVIDVFGGQVYTAPRAGRRRHSDLVAACEEIARAWEAV
jgi:hypothetical protein